MKDNNTKEKKQNGNKHQTQKILSLNQQQKTGWKYNHAGYAKHAIFMSFCHLFIYIIYIMFNNLPSK